jgi:pimeloyl-ACP methyl ester carboxylesterase
MGGMAALQAVLGDPAVARNLVLLATTAGGSGLTWPSHSVLNRMAETTNGLDLAVSVCFRSENPELYDAIAKDESAEARTVDPDALAQVFFSHDVADRLNEISMPVVVVCGSDDQFHPLPNSAYLVERLPQARFVRLGGVGHLLNVEAPEVLILEISHLANSP